MRPKIALLCSGLGNIQRGHEIFARDLFGLVRDAVDITLFKGGGEPAPGEVVIDNLPRNAQCLDEIHVAVSPKWAASVREQERSRIEHETFAYAALKPLLEGEFDVIHCLEQEVCNIIYDNRHLFAVTPKIVFSNGGAIPARDLPRCDFVQEHTDYNLSRSAKHKAFMIPHGVDLDLFKPGVESDFRVKHGIPQDAFVVISVGTVCYHHKRMDYVIREVAPLGDVYLVIVGQENPDTPAIKELGKQLMGNRIVFTKMQHDELPKAYAAADVFVLGSLFETFGIVYIEAMAMGLPVICSNHVNQRGIVKQGVFIDMKKSGALTDALRDLDRSQLVEAGRRSRGIAAKFYDLRVLKQRYVERYVEIAASIAQLPRYTPGRRIANVGKNAMKRLARQFLPGDGH
jgi:1,2-diacylglycerol 3-alpha-glucosyltransferase